MYEKKSTINKKKEEYKGLHGGQTTVADMLVPG
jgi:hypothetical protein